MKMWNVLRMAEGAEGGISEGVMDEVLARLALPKELMGETPKPKTQIPIKSQTPNPKLEETAEAKAAREAEEGEAKAAREMEEAARLENETPEEKAAREKAEKEAEAEAEKEPEFSEEQKAWMEARRAEVEAQVEEATNKAAAAESRVGALEKELTLARAQPRAVANLHPLMTESAEKIVEAERNIEAFEKWALANWDGTEGDAEGQGKFTAAQIRTRYGELKELREKVIPQAREAAANHAAGVEAAKKVYPELFDAKRGEAQLLEGILKVAPGLRVIFPNIHLIVGDALRGEKARLAAAGKVQASGPGGAAGGKVGGPVSGNGKAAVAPRRNLPPAARPGPGVGKTGPGKGPAAVSAKRFMELGGDRNALVRMLGETELPTERS